MTSANPFTCAVSVTYANKYFYLFLNRNNLHFKQIKYVNLRYVFYLLPIFHDNYIEKYSKLRFVKKKFYLSKIQVTSNKYLASQIIN